MTLPVTAIVVTRNEAHRIIPCLRALKNVSEIIVVDSQSTDGTRELVMAEGVTIIPFIWNGIYPKKRQWCLDFLPLKQDWVLFIDADEIVTPECLDEIDALLRNGASCAGYFITGRYTVRGTCLRFGQPNKKIALFNRHYMCFPEVDDLDIPGMGEVEGHYQPILKPECMKLKIGSLKNHVIHEAMEDERAWAFRHEKYARWEAGMNIKNAWPIDPIPWRQKAKSLLRATKLRPYIVFLAVYVVFGGFLDGRAGLKFAFHRYRYYCRIKQKQNELIQGE